MQINGALGFHFAHYSESDKYEQGVTKLSRYLPSTGVTGFYPTIPTVSKEVFQGALPYLKPKDIENGASVLGAHGASSHILLVDILLFLKESIETTLFFSRLPIVQIICMILGLRALVP